MNNNMHELGEGKEKGELKKAFSNLFGSFKYMFQSATGKMSIQSYLEVISEFTDDTIYEADKEGLNYIGGECFMALNPQNVTQIQITITMQFKTTKGVWRKKEAQRMLEKNTFTDEAIRQISMGEGLKFNIDSPIKK